jgi:hypothetical protein
VEGSCEHGNEPLGFIKGGKFFDNLLRLTALYCIRFHRNGKVRGGESYELRNRRTM